MRSANLGYSASTFWLRIPLQSSPGGEPQRLLEVAHFELDEVVFHAPGPAPVVAGLDHMLRPRP